MRGETGNERRSAAGGEGGELSNVWGKGKVRDEGLILSEEREGCNCDFGSVGGR